MFFLTAFVLYFLAYSKESYSTSITIELGFLRQTSLTLDGLLIILLYISTSLSKYKPIASLAFSKASSIVSPLEKQSLISQVLFELYCSWMVDYGILSVRKLLNIAQKARNFIDYLSYVPLFRAKIYALI